MNARTEALYLMAIAQAALRSGLRPREIGIAEDDTPIEAELVTLGMSREEARATLDYTYKVEEIVAWPAPFDPDAHLAAKRQQ